jgi:hypothetical protein
MLGGSEEPLVGVELGVLLGLSLGMELSEATGWKLSLVVCVELGDECTLGSALDDELGMLLGF